MDEGCVWRVDEFCVDVDVVLWAGEELTGWVWMRSVLLDDWR